MHPPTIWQQHIRSLSPSQQKALRVRLVADRIEADDWVCAALHRVPGVPCRGTYTAHEVVQRSVRPLSHSNPHLMVTCCENHHRWIHDNIASAEAIGLLRRSHEVDELGHLLPQVDAPLPVVETFPEAS